MDCPRIPGSWLSVGTDGTLDVRGVGSEGRGSWQVREKAKGNLFLGAFQDFAAASQVNMRVCASEAWGDRLCLEAVSSL